METKMIGKRIRERRKAKYWRQEDLASKTDLTPEYIGMIERREKYPKLETFIKISNALEVCSDELLQDVIDKSYVLRMNNYAKRIEKFKIEDQRKICNLIESILDNYE